MARYKPSGIRFKGIEIPFDDDIQDDEEVVMTKKKSDPTLGDEDVLQPEDNDFQDGSDNHAVVAQSDPAPETEPAQEEPEYGKHIFVDVGGTGFYEMVHVNHPGLRGIDPKTGWNRDRQLFLHGQNIEHVGEGVNGVWCYRSM